MVKDEQTKKEKDTFKLVLNHSSSMQNIKVLLFGKKHFLKPENYIKTQLPLLFGTPCT